MFPLKSAFISPHSDGSAIAMKFRLCPKLPWTPLFTIIGDLTRQRAKDIVSFLITVIGITVISGVCYMTLCQAHPIFAYEGNVNTGGITSASIGRFAFKAKAETPSKAEIEQSEYYRWKTHTDLKYKGQLISRPAQGVIHVKVTKWINNRPVRINIVEINKKLIQSLKLSQKQPALCI